LDKLLLIGQTLLFSSYFTVVLYFVHIVANRRVKTIFNSAEEFSKNNISLGFRRSGLYLGLSIGLFGIVGQNVYNSIMFLETLMLFLFMYIGFLISNKIILNKIENDQEIKNNNISIGIIEFAQFISIGIIAFASFNGEDGSLYSSILYFTLGQIVLTVIYYVYSKTIDFNIKKSLYEGNKASAILVGSIFIAYSIILKAAIEGPSNGLINDLTAFGVSAIFGVIILLLLANKIIDALFLPHTIIEDELKKDNYSSILVIGILKISIAIGVSSVIF